MNNNSPSFNDFGLDARLLDAITREGYTSPTPIQSLAIPLVMDGGDVLAAAQTGTGKTAAFSLPLLHCLLSTATTGKRKSGCPRALILTPTRELAAQVAENIESHSHNLSLSTAVIFGGVNINRQIQRLRKPVDVVIATPGRLLDLSNQRMIDLSGVEILILDEADRMLDMGFIHDIKRIMKLLPAKRQTLLFSATFSNEIRALARNFLKNPSEVDVAPRNTATETVQQTVHLVEKSSKRTLLSHLLRVHQWQQVLVFTRTKHGANRLSKQLGIDGFQASAIHGNKSQSARTQALEQFKNGRLQVLVATDIAARGLDIEYLPHVVNFELPHVAEDYVHRIGRTGRAGRSGDATSLVDGEEIKLLKGIERLINRKIERVVVDGFTSSNDQLQREERNRQESTQPGEPGNADAKRRKRRGQNRNSAPSSTNQNRSASNGNTKNNNKKRSGKSRRVA